jgi:hypothetical protein
MRKLKLLQVGDIHYPDAADVKLADHRDKQVPESLVGVVSAKPLQNAMRAVVQLCEQDPDIAGILLCGDLTSYGDLKGYQDCVEYLRRNIGAGSHGKWNDRAVHVVPGNHDVDRSLCDPDGKDVFRKFEQLELVWQGISLPVLATKSIRHISISVNGCTADVFSVNSCVGCGEHYFLPQELKGMRAALQELLKGLTSRQIFNLLDHQLDMPAFDEAHMTDLEAILAKLDSTTMPVVMAHHNLLPQAAPRIDIYTETINSGLVRSRLANRGKTVLYCHGHIHDEPIERVSGPETSAGQVVTVCTPEFHKGFNLLEIQYSISNSPLGCIVHAHRVGRDGSVREQVGGGTRIPFHGPSEAERLCHQRLCTILACIDTKSHQRFDAILQEARKNLGVDTPAQHVADVLIEAEWFSLVDILDREDEAKHWQVQRTVP